MFIGLGRVGQVKLTFDPAAAPRSRIGLGLAALGRPGYINIGHAGDLAGATAPEALEQRAHAVLDAAFAAGVRYFDAARSYGEAETFLGRWLRARGLGADEVTVASKWGYTYTAGWRPDAEVHEVKELELATLRRQLPETRERLGAHLRLYQIHSATLESGVLEDRDVLDELARLRAGGLGIGLTVSGSEQAAAIDRALEVGGFDAVQATWNLLEPSAGAALARAHAAGLLVIVKEALANGRLAGRRPVPGLEAEAAASAVTPDALALAAVLAQPWAGIVLSGASTAAMLASNLAAAELVLEEAVLERLRGLAEPPARYWQTRAELPWN
jgi:aryl-alcohol dehydrogenase-like predicted oxidoreductase